MTWILLEKSFLLWSLIYSQLQGIRTMDSFGVNHYSIYHRLWLSKINPLHCSQGHMPETGNEHHQTICTDPILFYYFIFKIWWSWPSQLISWPTVLKNTKKSSPFVLQFSYSDHSLLLSGFLWDESLPKTEQDFSVFLSAPTNLFTQSPSYICAPSFLMSVFMKLSYNLWGALFEIPMESPKAMGKTINLKMAHWCNCHPLSLPETEV